MTHRKFHIKKGDKVMIITGVHKGEEGRVLMVDRNKERAFVEGKNMVSKHTKPTSQYPEGGIIKKEAGIHISNLLLLDPTSGVATRIGRVRDEKTGKLKRIAKKSGEEIK